MKKEVVKKNILRMISILFMGSAFITIIPMQLSDQTAIIGYRAACPFAPISTILMFYAGLLIHQYLKNVNREKEGVHGKCHTDRGQHVWCCGKDH